MHAANPENFTQGGEGENNAKSTNDGVSTRRSGVGKKRTIVAWVPAQMTKQNRDRTSSSNKKARKDTISKHMNRNNRKNENSVMKDFFTKYLHNKKSKIRKMNKKSNINRKRNRIHKRNKSNKKRKRTRKNKIQNKKMDSEVKNAVAQLESLIQEKNKMKIISNDQHAIIERRDKIRTGNENDNTVISGPAFRPTTTSWFRRDLKETEADYYPSVARQIPNYQSERGYTRSEITGAPRSALRDPAELEKELLAKVEKAKRLLKENFINKRNQTNGITEEDSAKVDSLLLSKYEKQNSVLTNKLSNMLNDTKSVDNIINKLENEDEEENFLLKKENKAIAKHLVKSADDIYANDKRKLMEMDEEMSRNQQPNTDRAKKELYDMVALTNDTNSNVNSNREASEFGGVENVEEFAKSSSMNSSYDRDNVEASNQGYTSPYQRKGEELYNTVVSARNETNESIFPTVVNSSKVNPVPAEERNLTYTLDDEKQQTGIGGASMNETFDKDTVAQDYDEIYPKESYERPKGGFVSINKNNNNNNEKHYHDNNHNNNNHHHNNTMPIYDVEGMQNPEKPLNEESTQTQNEIQVGMAEDGKQKEETVPNDKNTNKSNDEESDDPKKQKMKEKKGREPMVQLAGPNTFGFGIANNNSFQNAITNKTKAMKNDWKEDETKKGEKQEGGLEEPKDPKDLKEDEPENLKVSKPEKEDKAKDTPKLTDAKKTEDEDLKDLKPEKEEKPKDAKKTEDDSQEDHSSTFKAEHEEINNKDLKEMKGEDNTNLLKLKKENEEDEGTQASEQEGEHGKKLATSSSKPGKWKDLKESEENTNESKAMHDDEENTTENHSKEEKDENKTPQGKDTLEGDASTSKTKNATQQQVEYEMLDYEKKTNDEKSSRDNLKKMDEQKQQQEREKPQQEQDNKKKVTETTKNEEEDSDLKNSDPSTAKEMLDYDKNVKLKNKTMELASLDQMKQEKQQNRKQGQDEEVDSEQQSNTKHKAKELDDEDKDGKQKDGGHSKVMAKEMLDYDETVKSKNKTMVDAGDLSQQLRKQNADSPQKDDKEEKKPSVEQLKNEKPEEKKVNKTDEMMEEGNSPKKINQDSKLPKETPEEKKVSKLPKEKEEEVAPTKDESKTSKLPEEKLMPKKEEDKLEMEEKSPKTPEEQLKLDVEKSRQDALKIDATNSNNINNYVQTDVGEAIDSVISKAAGSNTHLKNTSLTNGYSKKVFFLILL